MTMEILMWGQTLVLLLILHPDNQTIVMETLCVFFLAINRFFLDNARPVYQQINKQTNLYHLTNYKE